MFDECLCHNSSLWEGGPLDIELCLWVVISTSVPLAVLVISMPFLVLNIISKRKVFSSSDSWGKLNMARLTVTVVILILNILFSILEPCPSLRTLAIILSSLTTVLKVTLLVSVVKLQVTTSKTILIFWLLNSCVYVPNIILEFSKNDADKYYGPAMIAALVLSVVMLILQCFVYQRRDTSGEDGSSYVGKLMFSWLDFLFKKGFKQEIPVTDIPTLPEILHVQQLIRTFENSYTAEGGGVRKLVLALFKSFGSKFMIGAFLRAVNDVFLFVSPLIIQKLLNVIETNGDPATGYFWCTVLFVSAIAASLVSGQFFANMYQSGFQMRTAVMSAVFKKSLKLSTASRQKYSVGEITNLIAIDTQRFTDVIPYIHVVWSALFQIGLALYFLYGIVGNSAFAGMALLLTLVPANVIGNYYGEKVTTKQMELKDQRIMKINEILQGIKVIKYYAWEKPFMSIVNKIRKAEVRTIKQYAVVYSMLNVTFTIVPLLVSLATFTVYIYTDPENHILSAEKVFSCIAIFNVLRIPLFMFPMFFMETVKLYVSLKRLSKFLDSPEMDTDHITYQPSGDLALDVKNGSFTWKDDVGQDRQDDSALRDLSVKVEKGSLTAVVGQVGSGKSSLLAAVTGEIACRAGGLTTSCRSVAYVGQKAWIQNMTVKENILFGSEERPSHYQEVLEASALVPDLKLLPAGDATDIGENGVNLSGGQKQRVALARAAYSQAELYLLDDPLSAVDSHVAKHLFDKLIGPEGLLSQNQSTRIIVTHNLSFLNQMDRIILMEAGEVVVEGSYEDIKNHDKFKSYAQSNTLVESEEKSQTEIKEEESGAVVQADTGKLIEVEGRQEGRVSLMHYLHYIRLMNSFVFLVIVSLYCVSEGVVVLCNLVLAQWTDKAAVEDLSLSEHSKYIAYYGGLNVVVFLLTFVYNIWTYFRMTIPSIKMHQTVLEKTMHAPLSFFESNPSGRVLNRFTSDIEVVDRKIPFEFGDVIYCTANFVSGCITVSVIIPFILIPLVPILAGFVLLQMVFTRTRCQIKRHESVAKSPILSHFSETISGAATVRAFKAVSRFQSEFESKIEKHLTANYVSDMMNRWLSVRCDTLGNALIFLISVLTFYYRDSLSAGLAGLAVTYAISLLDALSWNIRMICDMETDSVAIERVLEYEKIEQEAAWETENVDEAWPRTGRLEVSGVTARYRENLPPCLEALSLSLASGEKLGVCGRTGAGKSSLASLLLRIIDPCQGEVRLDGLDTSTVGLQQLRARLTIVPQDCVMFSGSVSFNLDPWDSHHPDRVRDVLQVLGLQLDLNTEISESGGNLSMGERQLLCLGRAILRSQY